MSPTSNIKSCAGMNLHQIIKYDYPINNHMLIDGSIITDFRSFLTLQYLCNCYQFAVERYVILKGRPTMCGNN